ncbi:MAG TPA: hypothetical protein VGM77_11110 [Gemmatimonadales bacterium]|jgi:hypothetical protein
MSISITQQFGASVAGASNPTLTATPGSSIAAGALVIGVFRQGAGGAISGVGTPSGGGVTTWTTGPTDNNIHEWTAAVWYGISTGGTSPVTLALTATTTNGHFDVMECSGFDGGFQIDGTPAHSNGQNATSVTTSTTPGAGKNVLLISIFDTQGTTSITPTGYTAGNNGGPGGTPWVYQIVPSTTSSAYSITWAAGYARYAVLLVAIEAIAGGGGGGPVMPATGQLYPFPANVAQQFASTTRTFGQLFPF